MNYLEIKGKVIGPINESRYSNGRNVVNFRIMTEEDGRKYVFPVYATREEAEFFVDCIHENDIVHIAGSLRSGKRKVKNVTLIKDGKEKDLWLSKLEIKATRITLIRNENNAA